MAQGMIACRSNARELVEEADALLPNFARAYALLHTACEELAKFSVLELGGRRLARGDPPLWKRFWQRFRSHDSKIAQLNVQLLYLLAETEEVQLRKIVESMETLLDYGLTIRNSALYVDIGPDGKFRKPSDIDFDTPLPILRAATKLALDAADRRGLSMDDIELSLRQPQDELGQQNILKVLTKCVQRAKGAGLEKDKLVEMIEKIASGKEPK
jgi:AbiV family abortive infection protein